VCRYIYFFCLLCLPDFIAETFLQCFCQPGLTRQTNCSTNDCFGKFWQYVEGVDGTIAVDASVCDFAGRGFPCWHEFWFRKVHVQTVWIRAVKCSLVHRIANTVSIRFPPQNIGETKIWRRRRGDLEDVENLGQVWLSCSSTQPNWDVLCISRRRAPVWLARTTLATLEMRGKAAHRSYRSIMRHLSSLLSEIRMNLDISLTCSLRT
jgi:hypothetical protein